MSIFSRLFAKAGKPVVSYANQFDVQFDARALEATLLFRVALPCDTVSQVPPAFDHFALNPYNAKRLHWALVQALSRHEAMFGTLPGRPGQRTFATPANSSVGYVNTMQIVSNPEELIIEFKLNPRPSQNSDSQLATVYVIARQHVVAKCFMTALADKIAADEGANGQLELDVRNRLQH